MNKITVERLPNENSFKFRKGQSWQRTSTFIEGVPCPQLPGETRCIVGKGNFSFQKSFNLGRINNIFAKCILFQHLIQRLKKIGNTLRGSKNEKISIGQNNKPRRYVTHGLSHIGKIRQRNEDRYIVQEFPGDTLLIAVADGMGGEARGDLASHIMVEKFASMAPGPHGILSQLISTVMDVDRLLIKMSEKNPGLEGMGTTVTACIISDEMGYWTHVGDSRLYLMRNGELRQLTVDQTMVQFLIDEGELTLEEAPNHPARHHIEQCVGCGHCTPVSGILKVLPGDLLLFSTDGLHGYLSSESITALLDSKNHVREKANALIQEALKVGGKDNITVVIAAIWPKR